MSPYNILLIILLVVGETSGETLVSLIFAINLLWYIPELLYYTDYQQSLGRAKVLGSPLTTL
jgi:hypothetical protein